MSLGLGPHDPICCHGLQSNKAQRHRLHPKLHDVWPRSERTSRSSGPLAPWSCATTYLSRVCAAASWALGESVRRAKKQYDKSCCRTQYHVGDAVWYLVKSTRKVKSNVKKFLPSILHLRSVGWPCVPYSKRPKDQSKGGAPRPP